MNSFIINRENEQRWNFLVHSRCKPSSSCGGDVWKLVKLPECNCLMEFASLMNRHYGWWDLSNPSLGRYNTLEEVRAPLLEQIYWRRWPTVLIRLLLSIWRSCGRMSMAWIVVDQHRDKAYGVKRDLMFNGNWDMPCASMFVIPIESRSWWEAYSVTIRW